LATYLSAAVGFLTAGIAAVFSIGAPRGEYFAALLTDSIASVLPALDALLELILLHAAGVVAAVFLG